MELKTYDLLVCEFGEALAYQICESLGGCKVEIPKKAHKTHRIRVLIKKALPIIIKDKEYKTKIVKKLSSLQGVAEDTVYKIIREEEYGR